MSDLIDRQAALDVIDEIEAEVADGYGYQYAKWREYFCDLPPAQLGANLAEVGTDCISRQAAIDAVTPFDDEYRIRDAIEDLPSAQPDLGKYEYHYDHTDCIWYRPEARNRCPVTCAQYRDGWNDAMNYIFRNGKGYRPYRRGEQYEE